ncbi:MULTISPECIES: hypothetical protein [unclassified Flavobacterium]|uniref:hypothetical protein n=1 Tax=unclassified Flavobacterium TaxID=196869 RepID=UPI00131D2A67|nr:MULTISPECIES: hypothetical protein [unclassified Flavobacterium]
MRKSTLNLVSVLKNNLLEFPKITRSLQTKDPLFIEKLTAWIAKNEEILSTYTISEVAELSGLQSKLLIPRFADNKSISLKKAQLKAASEILYDLQSLILTVLKPFELKVEECRELVKQILLIISQAKVVKYDPDLPFENFVDAIWKFTTSNEQLQAGAIKLKTMLIMSDIQMLIAEEINLEDYC